MANERISVRKIKEVLRHRLTLGLSRAQTARALGIGRTTVGEYESRFKSSGLTFPLPETLDDAALEEKLFPKSVPAGTRQVLPLEYLAKEMKRPNMTLALLWEEYKKAHPEGYQYSQFAKLYRDYQKTLSYSMRQDHKAGEKGFVDFGEGLRILDRVTNETVPTNLFVHTWGASSCLFATATRSQDSKSWIEAHVACFDYFECIPKTLVPDNLKAAVIKACRYEPDLNPIYADLAAHYGFCVLPARPRRPKDKAKVENGVLLAKRWILARLRDRVFYSLEELNSAIRILVDEFNDRPLKKLGISRRALFLELDKPNALKLPEHPFEFAQWKSVRVGVNYHIEFERHFYSVPYTLIHQELEVRATLSVVEIYKDGQRVLTHQRNYKEHGYTTKKEHMPPSHQKYLEWTPERILEWARKYGPSVKELIEKIMAARAFPEQAYRSCLGIIRLANHYSPDRLDSACRRALSYHLLNYRGVKNILEKGLDKKEEVQGARVLIRHENLRGPEYYNQ
jgi:transposase